MSVKYPWKDVYPMSNKNRLILPTLLLAAFTLTSLAQDGPPAGGWGGGQRGGGMEGGLPGARGTGGVVIAVSGSTITIKTEEGDTYQILTGPNSRIMKQREPIKITEIHVGDAVMAGGELDAKAKTIGAVFVAVLTPEQAAQAKKMRDDYGKTWTAGEVTAIKDLDITVKRRDGTNQTISVDENTSFKKRADSITLADIQVGDRLMAQGGLKNGAFVATTVNIRPPSQPGEGRGNGQAPGAPANTPAPPKQ
jgi:hypothetical protein